MESAEHSLILKDGRTLAYHIFGEELQKDSHPVLYFNGFPGCGKEAGIACAPAIAKYGGQVFAIDRPGMGKTSSPYGSAANNKKDPKGEAKDMSDADSNLDTFMGNVWELVEDQGWEEFSVVGVSGGGPYTLALLASYLQQRRMDKSKTVARLRNVCLVGTLCLSAGEEGLKEELVQLHATVEKAQTSKWYRFQLATLCASMGPAYNYLVPYMPLSWMKYLISLGNKTSPPADREFMSREENIAPFVEMIGTMAAQGGYPGIYDDAMILLRANQPHEDVLRKIYGSKHDDNDLPSIGIFQGQSDANLPPSHAEYLHKSIFHEQAQVFRYEGLGHESTIMGEPDDYAAFATAERKK